MQDINICEPRDMSVRSGTTPPLSNAPIQQLTVVPDQNPMLNLLSNPIARTFLLMMQQYHQQIPQIREETQFVLPEGKELENLIRRTIQDHLPNKNSKIAIQGKLTITVDSGAPVTVKINTSSLSASKRKSYIPVRILPAVSPSQDSMSIDSGALDLSCAGSVTSAESSPVSPLKQDFAIKLNSPYKNLDFHGKMTSTPKRRFTGGRKLFTCNQCNNIEFPSLQNLEEHTMQVHGSYRCHVCSRTFTQRSNLQRHALKHVGFKPFQCGICLQGYYRKDHLLKHIKVNHPTDNPRESIHVFLSSSQSLDYLNTIKCATNYSLSDSSSKPDHAKEEDHNRSLN
nr:zinc finger protein [Hymenolepis microstoma]